MPKVDVFGRIATSYYASYYASKRTAFRLFALSKVISHLFSHSFLNEQAVSVFWLNNSQFLQQVIELSSDNWILN